MQKQKLTKETKPQQLEENRSFIRKVGQISKTIRRTSAFLRFLCYLL